MEQDGARQPYRVLVAEDDEAMRAFVARALAHVGFHVTAVPDGGQALQALAAERYDLLVADIVMPVVDGVALSLMATKEQPDLRVLLITGYPEEGRRARNLDALIHGVLPKPFTLQELTRQARGALAGR